MNTRAAQVHLTQGGKGGASNSLDQWVAKRVPTQIECVQMSEIGGFGQREYPCDNAVDTQMERCHAGHPWGASEQGGPGVSDMVSGQVEAGKAVEERRTEKRAEALGNIFAIESQPEETEVEFADPD